MVRRLESVFDIRFKEWIIEGRGRVSLMNKWRENPGGFVLISVGRKQGNKTLLRSPLVRCRCSKVRIVSRLSSISVTLLIEFLSFPPPSLLPKKNIHRVSRIIPDNLNWRKIERLDRVGTIIRNYIGKIEFDVTSTGRGDLLFNRRKWIGRRRGNKGPR